MKNLLILAFLAITSVAVAQVRPLHEHYGYGTTYYFPYGSNGAPGYAIPYTTTSNSGTWSGSDGNGTAFTISWSISNNVLTYSFSATPTNSNVITYHTFNIFDDLSSTDYISVEEFDTSYESTVSYSGSVNLGQTQRNIEFNFAFYTNNQYFATGHSMTDGYTSIHYMQPTSDPQD